MPDTERPSLFSGLGPRSIIISIVIFFLLGWARLAILVLPFRWLALILGRDNRNVQLCTLVDRRRLFRARRLGMLIRGMAEHTPWESNCLAQAVVATVFLRLFGISYVLHLGVAKDGNEGLSAHAWVKVGPCAVTGGEGVPEFAVVSTFLSPSLTELNIGDSVANGR